MLFAFTSSPKAQGLYLMSDTVGISTDSVNITTFYLKRLVFDFADEVIYWEDKITNKSIIGTDTIYEFEFAPVAKFYPIHRADTIVIGGTSYTAIQILNALLDAGDRQDAKLLNRYFIRHDPNRFNY